MPSAIVHLKVAYDLKEKLSVTNSGQFYAGSVSPDAVNVDGFAAQEIRYPAHLRSLDYEEWKQNTRSFFKANKQAYAGSPDYLLGFILHILTDIYWDEIAQPEMFEALSAYASSQQELRDLKWKELYRFNAQLEGDWLYNEVLPSLKSAEPLAIATVSKELVGRHLEYLTTEYMEKKSIDEPPLICNQTMIDRVEQACLEELAALQSNN